jgi:hypothetical protein
MTYTEFIIGVENNIAEANCNKLNIGEYEEKQKQIYNQIRADAIDDFAKRLKAECRKHYVDCDPYFGGIVDSILYEDDIDEIAELLKERKE